jgi:hypothetical protein
MLESYVSAGLPPGRFWKITPRLYMTEMRGAAARIDREHNELAWAAWHIAFLPRAKRAPALSDMIVGPKRTAKAKPWQEQLSAWEALAQRGA